MKRTHPGRPRLDDDDISVPVCVTMPGKQFEGYRKQAALDSVSIPEIIRRELREKKKSSRKKI